MIFTNFNQDDILKQLQQMIEERSFRKTDTPTIPLSSGKMSYFYFNLKEVTLFPESIAMIGFLVYNKIKELELKVSAIGGLTIGADPIAIATSFVSYIQNDPIKSFIIRKEPKQYGTKRQIEGSVDTGDSVVILDDVVTTGTSTIKAINVARDNGLNILAAITLVDRCEENGRQNIEATGVRLYSIYNIYDFVDDSYKNKVNF